MERAEKAGLVTELQSSFSDAGSIVVARNTGLTVADLENLRRQMKEAGGSVKIAKNRLAKLALKETETADIADLFTGPTVLAFAKDPMTAPKVAAAAACWLMVDGVAAAADVSPVCERGLALPDVLPSSSSVSENSCSATWLLGNQPLLPAVSLPCHHPKWSQL